MRPSGWFALGVVRERWRRRRVLAALRRERVEAERLIARLPARHARR